MNISKLLSCALMLFTSVLFAQLRLYRKLPEIPLSAHYKVEVKQGNGSYQEIFTYNLPQNSTGHDTKNDQITAFGFNPSGGAVQIRVTRKDGVALTSANSRLMNKRYTDVTQTHAGGAIVLTCSSVKRHLYVQVDGKREFPLLVFVDPQNDTPIPAGATVHTFAARNTAHVINNAQDRFTVPNNVDVVMIEDGALVKGTIHLADNRSKPLMVIGRGMLMGNGAVLHGAANIPYNALVLKKARNHTVENIMIVNSRHFTLDVGPGSTVDNVKMFGYDANNDGIVALDNCTIQNVFSKVNDDHIKLYHENVVVRNCTFWEQKNGAIFQLAWNAIVPGSNCLVENCEVLAWEAGCGDPKLGQGGVARSLINLREHEGSTTPVSKDNTFRNIHVQGKMDRFICINGKYQGSKPISLLNYKLENVTIEQKPNKYSWLYTGGSGRLEFSFNNVTIAGECITANNYQFNKEGDVQLSYLGCGNNTGGGGTEITVSDISNLQATAQSCSTVSLIWGDVSGETAYRIRRKENSETAFTNLTDVAAGTTSYTDNTAQGSKTYVYQVRPVVDGIAVATSNEPTVTTSACTTSGGGSSGNTSHCISAIKYPGGRMALSFDGNVHDDDDIIALPVSMAMIWAAGLKDKVAHVEYGNHVCSHGVEDDGTANFRGDDAVHMRASASGSINRFGFDGSVFFDYTTQANAATNHFIQAINASTANDPLYIIAAGPMETVYRALNGAQASKRQYVTVISHSRWNQTHGDCGSNSHTWSDMVNEFSTDGVFFVESCGYNNTPCSNSELNSSSYFPDQNQSNGDNDFNTPIDKWHWLRDSDNADLRWVFSRNPFGNKFDPSDAGMVYFMITGGPFNGGAKKAGWPEAKTLLENPCEGGSSGSCEGYKDVNGIVMMEAENTTSNLGQWIIKTDNPNYSGEGHIEFTGNTENGGPATSPLEYTFTIQEEGYYRLYMRARKRLDGAESDKCNDGYVKLAGDFDAGPNAGDNHNDDAPESMLRSNTKFFGGPENGWGWASMLDAGGTDNKRVPIYYLKAGETYTLTLSGRSIRWNVDRIVFRKESVANNVAQAVTEETGCSGGGNNGGGTGDVADIDDLELLSTSCTSVTLTWSGVQGAEQYRIRRKLSGTTAYEVLTDVSSTTTSYLDETALENTSYDYMVRPMVGGIAVALSNVPTVVTESCVVLVTPNDINDLEANSPTCTTVTLTWTDVDGETGYRIRRKLVEDATYTNLTDVPANTEEYTDNTAEEGKVYQYMVRPVVDGVAVALSNQPEVETELCVVTALEDEAGSTLSYFPNPVSTIIYFNESISWQLSSSMGQFLDAGEGEQIDMNEYPSGLYFIHVHGQLFKIVKK